MRTRSERFLVGVATALCSAVVVVVLGLVADVSAGVSGRASAGEVVVPAGAVPVPGRAVPAPWDGE